MVNLKKFPYDFTMKKKVDKLIKHPTLFYGVLFICFWNFFQTASHSVKVYSSESASVELSFVNTNVDYDLNSQPCSQDCDDENCPSHHCHFGHCQTLGTTTFQFHSPKFSLWALFFDKSEIFFSSPQSLKRPPKA